MVHLPMGVWCIALMEVCPPGNCVRRVQCSVVLAIADAADAYVPLATLLQVEGCEK